MAALPPWGRGPKADLIFGHLGQFGRDPLAFLERSARDYGDFVPLRFLAKRIVLVNDPAAIETVLGGGLRDSRKTIGYRTPFMRRLFGHGLLTNEGDSWLRQRRLAQPAFHRDRIAGYGTAINELTATHLAAWRSGEERNVHHDMLQLTTRVVTKTLFNAAPPPEVDEMGAASEAVMHRFAQQFRGFRIFLGLLPSPTGWRFRTVMNRLDSYIYRLIAERRATGRDEGDLLSMLLRARDEDGQGMADRQLRDELVTLMVAGLDTTALALSWALHLLALNPSVAAALQAEVDAWPAEAPPGFADLPRLPLTEAVIKESMRLYPPAWIVGRELLRPVEIGGHTVPAGTSILMSQWLQHHDARHFPEPLRFHPGRWLTGETQALPKFAYFPFGGGARVCIGSGLAMLEAVLVLAQVARRFHFTAPPGHAVTPWPAITLYPRGGIRLRVTAR